ncbi:hypothetical protein RFI_04025 [Reticulomyxa filosa]|uniref:Uncharacterized protein n=1 Tax=Reticulomyxa filosa TaxID=46433 RepID=X6P640_RETFI|nr:hypothetical protein RFI_04025 [Reticulomyxa filosa]|eukprot:ETO33082.1 hypothetical protein RFI_04025 [Reticulomyxa filosa]
MHLQISVFASFLLFQFLPLNITFECNHCEKIKFRIHCIFYDDYDLIELNLSSKKYKRYNQEIKEEEFQVCVILDKREKLINMKQLTFEELIKNENLKFELVNMQNNIIDSDESIIKEFRNKNNKFKIIWIPVQKLMINHALVISGYDNTKSCDNLSKTKENCVTNFSNYLNKN